YARSFDDRRDHIRQQRSTLKPVSGVGYITCDEEKKANDEDCDLKFIRKSDLEEFEVVDSPAVLAAHMEGHKNLKVDLSGRVTMSAIFHDDHLRVEKFTVLGEVDNLAAITEEQKIGSNKKIQIIDRGGRSLRP